MYGILGKILQLTFDIKFLVRINQNTTRIRRIDVRPFFRT